MRQYLLYILGINVLIFLLLLWMGQERLKEFKAYHLAIAQESTSSASRAIEHFIAEKKRLVSLFAMENQNLINQYASEPENADISQQLNARIKSHFPEYFTFMVTNATGIPFVEDFEGYVGDLCKTDLRKFIIEGKQFPRIHPNQEVYHFDIIAPLNSIPSQLILFISFKADILGKVLESAQTSGHQLMLIDPAVSQLIEVTADGARVNWDRSDYRLSEDEKSRILSSQKVNATVWHAVDISLPYLFNDFKSKLFVRSVFILLLFVVVSIAMFNMLRREERLRKLAEQNKENFLAVVSHDIRTPITSIRGSLDLIKNGYTGEVSDETLEYLNIAIKNSDNLVNLINDLLDLQKIEAGSMRFTLKNEALSPLVSNAIKINTSYAELFNASCRLQILVDDLSVNVDASRFEQAFTNLLTNAFKYGAKGDEIIVSIDKVDNLARVAVTDHGQGIPESSQHQVFKKFTQFNASKTGQVKGTGLGLSIVKTIIERQDGHVGFKSSEGKGSTFYIDLPLI